MQKLNRAIIQLQKSLINNSNQTPPSFKDVDKSYLMWKHLCIAITNFKADVRYPGGSIFILDDDIDDDVVCMIDCPTLELKLKINIKGIYDSKLSLEQSPIKNVNIELIDYEIISAEFYDKNGSKYGTSTNMVYYNCDYTPNGFKMFDTKLIIQKYDFIKQRIEEDLKSHMGSKIKINKSDVSKIKLSYQYTTTFLTVIKNN